MTAHRQFFLVCLLAGASLPCTAAPREVPGDFPSIAAALAAAGAGDEVVVAAGIWLEHDLNLPSGVILRGATGNPAEVVIDAGRLGRCVYGTNLAAGTELRDLTLSGGLPSLPTSPNPSWGAGLMVDGGEPTITNCVFAGNETAVGGGAFIIGTGTPRLTDCIFDGNTATESAGLVIRGECDPVVRNCTFRNGYWCLLGGGLTWSGSGNAQFEDCVVQGNTVLETGGGVEVYGPLSSAIFRNCLIEGNSARIGGGGLIVGNGGQVFLFDCTVTGNTALSYGGGVVLDSQAVLQAVSTTIIGNTAGDGADGSISSTAVATLTCCTFDSELWFVNGLLVVDDEGCAVATEGARWGDVKAAYR